MMMQATTSFHGRGQLLRLLVCVALPVLACARGAQAQSSAPARLGAAAEAGTDPRAAALGLRPGDVRLGPDVLVRRIAPGLWAHISLSTGHEAGIPAGYPSNGMLLETADGGSVLFDTAWNDAETEHVLRWAATTLHHPVRRAVLTHSHVDRLGGLGALHAHGIPAATLALTIQRARRDGLLPAGGPAPDSIAGLVAAPVRDRAGFTLFYPGAGHAPDNIVAYFPRQRVLFGGCLVKADTATTLGNVASADLANWPRAVARVREAYPEARIVVPGHGAIGGPSALIWTERLVREKGGSAAHHRP